MITVNAIDRSEVTVTGPEALKQWYERHRLFVPNYEHTPLYKRGHWDGTKVTGKWCKLRGDKYEWRGSRGLVPRIVRDLELGTEFDFVGSVLRERASEWCARHDKYAKLRDYQQRAFKGVIDQGWGRVAFATNAGKGAVIALLAAFGRDHMLPVLVLCDELAVFDALRGEFRDWAGFEPGLINRGVGSPPISRVTLAMIPTLARRLAVDIENEGGEWIDWMQSIQMILVDEADKAKAESYTRILTTATNTIFRAGFSGTFPSDQYSDVRLDEALGPIIDRVVNKEMVERGVSARPLIEVHSFDCTNKVGGLGRAMWTVRGPGRRRLVYEQALISNFERHEFIRSLIHPGERTAIVVNRVEHGAKLQGAIPGSVFIDGQTSEAERLQVLDDFQLGKIQTIIVTKILDRGSNRLGHTETLIFASGEGSTTQTLQRIGRGLRRAGGKEFLRLVDIADRVTHDQSSKKHFKIAATFLHGAVRRRLQVYGEQGFDISIFNGDK